MTLLSIIVISHNQRDALKRCLDSILAQAIPFEYEILVSDDASSDGSFELAQDYEHEYPVIHAYSCNTDDFNPANSSIRSGWNRCNAYQYAKGKYIAHVDGDDFFHSGVRIYERQVELLEEHPECSCCMANDYSLKEGEDESRVVLRHGQILTTGQVLNAEVYLRNYFRESHSFVYRRNPDVNPVELYGGYYVDTLLTSHYLQFGDIVCLDDAGYIYVQYENSIWNQNLRSKDHIIIGCPLIYVPAFIPKWKYTYFGSYNYLNRTIKVLELALQGYNLRQENCLWLKGVPNRFVCTVFNRNLKAHERIRLYLIKYILVAFRRIARNHPSFHYGYSVLDKLL